MRAIAIIQSSTEDHNFISQHRRHPSAFTRDRKLTFGIVIATILHLAKRSLQIECNLIGEHLMTTPTSKQAFSKARYKVSHTGFKALNRNVLEEIYAGDSVGLWYGYRVFGLDGSTLRMPTSDETEQYFGRPNRSTEQGGQCPVMARISEVVELTTGIIVDAAIAPWHIGERTIAKEQISSVTTLFHGLGQSKQIFIFDRGYVSKDLMQLILESKADFMFRVPRGFNLAIDKAVEEGDTSKEISLSVNLPPMRLIIRNLSSNENCVLLTSVNDSISDDDVFELYWMRWTGCEEGYKKQKIALELENFSGLNLEAVLQEFWATVLAVNIFQLECLDEEGAWDIKSPPKKRINRAVVFGSLRRAVFSAILGEITAEEFHAKFLLIARRSQIKVRPGRTYSREKVGKPKRHHTFRRVC